MIAEYDFSRRVPGKYAKRYSTGTNIVVINPDITSSIFMTITIRP